MATVKTTEKGIEYLVGLFKEKAKTISRAIFILFCADESAWGFMW